MYIKFNKKINLKCRTPYWEIISLLQFVNLPETQVHFSLSRGDKFSLQDSIFFNFFSQVFIKRNVCT